MNISKNILCRDPEIYTIDNFLSNEECDHFIKITSGKFDRALVVSDNVKGTVSSGRSGENTWIEHKNDNITLEVGTRIAELVNMPLENAEAFQVIHYGEKQEYYNHYDSWDHDYSTPTLRCIKIGGTRLLTALLYLNDVEEGGGTRLSKLNIEVRAKKGKLLVFRNVYEGGHFKHELSEHAGMPVIKGEKYAVNLWFKECPKTIPYQTFNPCYYDNIFLEMPSKILKSVVPGVNDIKFCDNFVSDNEYNLILDNLSFNVNSNRGDCWIDKTILSSLTKKIEKLTGMDARFYENYNAIFYKQNDNHCDFIEAYDLNTELGKKYCEKTGQRMYTIVLFLTNSTMYNFTELNVNYQGNKNSLLIYKNTIGNTTNQNHQMIHSIINNQDNLILNLYVREKDLEKNMLSNITRPISLHSMLSKHLAGDKLSAGDKPLAKATKINEIDNIGFTITEMENYTETYNEVYNMFKEGKINTQWLTHKSFSFTGKTDINVLKRYISQLITEREKNPKLLLLKEELLKQDYYFDEFTPIKINNVLNEGVLDILKSYYKETISSSVFDLGDGQSNRYKAGDEAISRFLHYELLPLFEVILKKKLKPTYTYLSAYIKDADLPPHTDRPECEYTVSFIVDKPDNAVWPIYIHKTKQEKKYVGGYKFTPPKEDCIEFDCDAGGLMMFCGTDHIHYREKLPVDYYNVLLLHYCSL
jgi:prolyl 4-hydroxylase